LALVLAPGGSALTQKIRLLVAAASLAPGIIAATQAKDAASSKRALDGLQKEVEVRTAKADLVSASDSYRELAAAFAELTAPINMNREELEPFDTKLIQVLGQTLAGPNERFLSPLRVVFLRRLSEDASTSGDTPRVLLRKEAGRAWGYLPKVYWEIYEGTDDAQVAELIMAGEPPFRDRGFLITDVDLPTYDGRLYLKSPEVDGARPPRSYCRVAVGLPQQKRGILCVDTWHDSGLSDSDRKTTEAFAYILAAILGAIDEK
jgi:hypothetical protein